MLYSQSLNERGDRFFSLAVQATSREQATHWTKEGVNIFRGS